MKNQYDRELTQDEKNRYRRLKTLANKKGCGLQKLRVGDNGGPWFCLDWNGTGLAWGNCTMDEIERQLNKI